MLEDPKNFGRMADPELAEDVESEVEDAVVQASLMQHKWALGVRNALKDAAGDKISREMVCERAEIDYTRLSRLLNGSIILRLEDIARVRNALARLSGDDFI